MFSQTFSTNTENCVQHCLCPHLRSTAFRFSFFVTMEAALPSALNFSMSFSNVVQRAKCRSRLLPFFLDLSISFGCVDEYILKSYFVELGNRLKNLIDNWLSLTNRLSIIISMAQSSPSYVMVHQIPT